MRSRRQVVMVSVFLVGILLTGCTPLVAQSQTYHGAITEALDERAVAYRDVHIYDDCHASPSDCFRISVIVRTSTRSVAGWINCQNYHYDCALWLPALDIRAVSLPALVQSPPWLKGWQRYLNSMGVAEAH
jgi:hypothetical protein